MRSKDLIRRFKAADWPSEEAVMAFVEEAGEVPPDDMAALLDVLTSRRAAGVEHRNRLFVFQKLAMQSLDRELFGPFMKALRTDDENLQNLLTDLLPRVNNVGQHRDLCMMLRLKDERVRTLVGKVLGRVGGKTAFGLLTEMIRSPDFVGRVEAMRACVKMAGHHAVPALRAVLQAGSVEEKEIALDYLVEERFTGRNPEPTLEAIQYALKDRSDRIVVKAIRAYAAHCDEDAFFEHLADGLESGNLDIVRATVGALARFTSPRVIAALEKNFRLGPNVIRMAVVDVLAKIGDESVLPLLVEAMHHRNINVRKHAAEVLTELAVARQVDLARTIIWLLRSRDVNVKRFAADIAKKVGDPSGELWPKLLRFLRDEDWWVRERVMDALIDMAGTNLTRHMVGYLQDESDIIRRYAVNVLLRLADPKSLGALVRVATSDEDWWVQEKAIEAIAALGDQRAAPYVIKLMKEREELQIICLEALRTLDARDATPHALELLHSPDVDVRLSVLKCIDVFEKREHADAISELLSDEDHQVREYVRELLRKWDYEQRFDAGASGLVRTLSQLERLLVLMARKEGDDLILASGRRPYIKRMGGVEPLADKEIRPDQMEALLYPHLTAVQQDTLESGKEVDFSFEVKTHSLRFRANVFLQNTGLGAVFRIIKGELLDFETLGLPEIIRTFGDLRNGLVLVGGPTGSGKSTTLAALIDYINRTYARHIITLEDPIEVVHRQKKCLINQRELGTHTHSFTSALRATLREDPDVILVGEMRDLDTISFAITAAETGHLVFGTVHTVSADTSIDRIINAFPPGEQPQVRASLAGSLRAVVCQHLLPKKDGKGRTVAVEIMLNSDAIANLIRKGKTYQIPSVVTTSQEVGMRSMDWDLMRLYKAGLVASEDVYVKAMNKKEFEALFAEEGKSGEVELLRATGEMELEMV